nr:MAG TPA: hypothetical protein [Caudoviricetes sp.]
MKSRLIVMLFILIFLYIPYTNIMIYSDITLFLTQKSSRNNRFYNILAHIEINMIFKHLLI